MTSGSSRSPVRFPSLAGIVARSLLVAPRAGQAEQTRGAVHAACGRALSRWRRRTRAVNFCRP